MEDLLIKVMIALVTAIFMAIGGFALWMLQKIATYLFNTFTSVTQLIADVGVLKADMASFKKYIDKTDKNEADLNHYFQRLKSLEEKTKEL